MDLVRFVTEMRLALYQCGPVARGLRRKVAREEKEPDSRHQMSTSVSAVDRLCQEILPLRAYEVAPYLEIESEEPAECPDEILALFAGNSHQYALILDPVDGTGDYLDGNRTYGHMLGVLNQETGRMGCGTIHFPETARLYTAVRGMGAFVARDSGGFRSRCKRYVRNGPLTMSSAWRRGISWLSSAWDSGLCPRRVLVRPMS